VIAYAAAAAVVLGAPIIGDLRNALLRAFPRYYLAIIGGSVVLGALILLAACVRHIRDHRLQRYGALAAAVALALVSFRLLRSGVANVDAVEAFHFIEYSVLALLFFPFHEQRRRWEPYVDAALACTVVAVADEWFQWFVPGRAGELHDVLFDLVATACGLCLCFAVRSGPSLVHGEPS
jgi:hypothetical protein